MAQTILKTSALDVTVAWDMGMYSVREDSGSLMACVVVTAGTLCRDIEVFVSTADSTTPPPATGIITMSCRQWWSHLTGDADYGVLSSQSLTLTAGTTSTCVTVDIVNDMEPEEALEFFSLELSSTDSDVIIPTPTARVAIQNDDSEWCIIIVLTVLCCYHFLSFSHCSNGTGWI